MKNYDIGMKALAWKKTKHWYDNRVLEYMHVRMHLPQSRWGGGGGWERKRERERGRERGREHKVGIMQVTCASHRYLGLKKNQAYGCIWKSRTSWLLYLCPCICRQPSSHTISPCSLPLREWHSRAVSANTVLWSPTDIPWQHAVKTDVPTSININWSWENLLKWDKNTLVLCLFLCLFVYLLGLKSDPYKDPPPRTNKQTTPPKKNPTNTKQTTTMNCKNVPQFNYTPQNTSVLNNLDGKREIDQSQTWENWWTIFQEYFLSQSRFY